jgi:hypothetical protein
VARNKAVARDSQTFSLINETDSHIPAVDFVAIKNATLGKDYTLNLIFTDSARIKKLNTIYRNKECATDILSFPLSDTEGEIYISEKEARGLWCCNLWLEPTAFSTPVSRQTLYIAREVVQAVPIYARRWEDLERWWRANTWVCRWSAVGWITARRRAHLLLPSHGAQSLFISDSLICN